jgi:hydrogenase expression/formation protein HypC
MRRTHHLIADKLLPAVLDRAPDEAHPRNPGYNAVSNPHYRGSTAPLGTLIEPPSRSEEQVMCLAIPGQVIEFVDAANRLAKVDVAGVRRTVNVGLLDADDDGGAQPGDWVLIHVGFALSKVDEEEAHATLELLRGMGSEFEDAIEELKGSVIR